MTTTMVGERGGADVEIRVLGPFELRIAGEVVAVTRVQSRRLLTALVLEPDVPVSSDVLIDELWPGEVPEHPRKALQVVVSRVRSLLGAQAARLSSDGDRYRLEVDRLDHREFVALVDQARESDAEDAVARLQHASSLWRGDPFDEDPEGGRAAQQRVSLVEQRWFVITRLVELCHELGDPGRAVALGSPFVEEALWRERLVAAMARALASDGRKSEALRLLARTSDALRDSGLVVSRPLVSLERAILHGDVDLRPVERSDQPSVGAVFVGRDRELGLLLTVEAGRPVVVVGDAGIGKSSLIVRAAEEFSRRGVGALRVAVRSSPERPLDTLAQLCETLAREAPPSLVARHEAVLVRLCPEVVDRRSGAVLTRDALLAGIATFVEEAIADRVLILDDAHWLDVGSAEVVERLLGGSAVRAIVALRPSADAGIAFLIAPRDSRMTSIELGPLSGTDVAELVAAARAGRPAPEVASEIAERSGGNALFVRLLIDRWVEHPGSDDLPTSVLVAVRERLDALSVRSRQTLLEVSVFGRHLDLHVARQLTPSADGDLVAAEAAGLIDIDRARDSATFVHQLVAEACYELLPAGRRVALHDRVGRLLQRAGAEPSEFARHLVRAAEFDPMAAVRAAIDAATSFAAGFDWENARSFLVDATRVADDHAIATPSLRAELAVRRGTIGRALHTDGYVTDLMEGAQLAEQIGDQDLLVVAAIELCGHGRSTAAGVVDDAVVGLLHRALVVDVAPTLRAELCSSAAVLLSHTNDTVLGRSLYREALAIVDDLDDVEVEAAVLEHAHLGLAHPDDFDELCGAAARLGALASGDPGLEWEAAFLTFQTAAVRGDGATARASMDRMRTWAPRVRERSRDFGMCFSESALAQIEGDFERAQTFADRTLEVGLERYPASWAFNLYALLLLGIRGAQGRLHEMDGALDAGIAEAPDFLPYRIAAAAISADAGDLDRVRRELDVVLAGGLDAIPHDAFWTAFMVLLARPVIAVGTAGEQEMIRAELLRFAGRLSWNGATTCGAVDDALADLAEAAGDRDAAAAWRGSAATLLERLRTGQSPAGQ